MIFDEESNKFFTYDDINVVSGITSNVVGNMENMVQNMAFDQKP